MKFAAFVLVMFTWILLLAVLSVGLKFSYSFRGFNSKIRLELKILFSRLKLEVNIPEKMLTEGFQNIFNNIIEDVSNEDCQTPQEFEQLKKEQVKKQQERRKNKRYTALKNASRELLRHYFFSWARLLWIKSKLVKLKKYFYSKIQVHSLSGVIEVGGRDAAETGLIAGAFWIFWGQMTARLYRLVNVKKNNIRYNVVPRFDEEIFLCRLNCILSVRISHIIFTAYKFLIFILKNRRIRNYGRTSD